MSHPAWVCGLKLARSKGLKSLISHTLRGCVDWNHHYPAISCDRLCHTLRGCVDWNVSAEVLTAWAIVTPCVGVWIETYQEISDQLSIPVTPCVGVWIETVTLFSYKTPFTCHTLRGCVDWNTVDVNTSLISLVTPCVGVWIETAPQS